MKTMAIAVCLVLLAGCHLGCQAQNPNPAGSTTQPVVLVPTTQTVQIEQALIGGGQIALDDAQVTVAILTAAGKITAPQAARIDSAIQFAQSQLNTWSQHVGDPLAVQLQAGFQTAVANVNLLLTSSQAKLQAPSTQPSP